MHYPVADRVARDHQLKDAGPPAEAGIAATVATGAAIQRRALRQIEVRGQLLVVRLVRLLAVRADRPHQALCHRRRQGAGYQVGLHAYVQQARHRGARVVRVKGREHQVPGQRRLHGRLGRLQVADLADHHDIRIVSQNGAQPAREGHVDLGVHLYLVDSVQVILDGVFDGEQLDLAADDFLKRRVQGGRLSAAGRAGYQDDPVRTRDQGVEQSERVGVHAQFRQRVQHGALVENPHDDPLAEEHRDHADADVDLASAHLELYPPVLREALLGDVQVGHDLDTADDRRLELADLRGDRGVLKHAVDAIADAQVVLVRLDMNIAGPLVQRLQEYLVDQLYDRCLLGHLQQVFAVLGGLGNHPEAVGAHHLVDGVAADAEVGLYELGDLVGRREYRFDLQPCHQPQLVEGVQVERVGGGHRQRVVVAPDGNDLLAEDQFGRQGLQRLGVELHRRQVDRRDRQLLPDDLQQLFLADAAHFQQRPVEAQALGLAEVLGPGKVLGAHKPLFQQHFSYAHGCSPGRCAQTSTAHILTPPAAFTQPSPSRLHKYD